LLGLEAELALREGRCGTRGRAYHECASAYVALGEVPNARPRLDSKACLTAARLAHPDLRALGRSSSSPHASWRRRASPALLLANARVKNAAGAEADSRCCSMKRSPPPAALPKRVDLAYARSARRARGGGWTAALGAARREEGWPCSRRSARVCRAICVRSTGTIRAGAACGLFGGAGHGATEFLPFDADGAGVSARFAPARCVGAAPARSPSLDGYHRSARLAWILEVKQLSAS